jgi:hypothetical protein
VSTDSAGPLGTYKGLHHDGFIRDLLNLLTTMESAGYSVTTPADSKVGIDYPDGGTVDLVFSMAKGQWVAVEHNEWGTE